jgi:protein-tyrosine phosphatase
MILEESLVPGEACIIMNNNSAVVETKALARQMYDTIWYLARKRRISPCRTGTRNLHFICYGNICRSPFSEYYARDIFHKSGLDIGVSSSGLSDRQGATSPEEAIIAAGRFGVNLGQHKSSLITRAVVEENNLIVGMHCFHFREFNKLFFADSHKFYLLKHLVWPRYMLLNIDDPFGKPSEEYIACFSQIKTCIDILVKNIKDRLMKGDNRCL